MERLFTDELAAIIDEAKEACLQTIADDNILGQCGAKLMAMEIEYRIRIRDKDAEIKELEERNRLFDLELDRVSRRISEEE